MTINPRLLVRQVLEVYGKINEYILKRNVITWPSALADKPHVPFLSLFIPVTLFSTFIHINLKIPMINCLNATFWIIKLHFRGKLFPVGGTDDWTWMFSHVFSYFDRQKPWKYLQFIVNTVIYPAFWKSYRIFPDEWRGAQWGKSRYQSPRE